MPTVPTQESLILILPVQVMHAAQLVNTKVSAQRLKKERIFRSRTKMKSRRRLNVKKAILYSKKSERLPKRSSREGKTSY
eukprot:scaffold4912_cov74-Skeletonema_dohrnii-CCMP3373.AAC.6